MVPVIRVSEGTYEHMKAWAEPLVDGPDDVVKKLLKIAEEHRLCLRPPTLPSSIQTNRSDVSAVVSTRVGGRQIKKTRLPRGLRTPERDFLHPILEALYEQGGGGDVVQVLNTVHLKVKHLLRDVDNERIRSGEIRWRNTAQWARWHLVSAGLLKDTSQKGVWQLTDAGVQVVEGKSPLPL